MLHEFTQYAPLIIVVIVFVIQNKIFVTPAQLEVMRKQLTEEVEKKFLSLVAFRQFEKRMNDNFKALADHQESNHKQFEHINEKLDHITDILINHKH